MRGIDRLRSRFEAQGGPKLMAHAVVGYPSLGASRRILGAMAEAGADFIEAQLPFSDPSADGPAIVEANSEALKAGSRTEACLAALEDLGRGTEAPILIMSYLNPLLAQGLEALTARAEAAGISGFIVPDYPDDEPELRFGELCAARGLALVPLIAPTTSLERAARLAEASASPFLYVILRLGVTGRRTAVDEATLERLGALGRITGKRIAAGFGLRERAQLQALNGHIDCAVVGTALIEATKEAEAKGLDASKAVAALIKELKS